MSACPLRRRIGSRDELRRHGRGGAESRVVESGKVFLSGAGRGFLDLLGLPLAAWNRSLLVGVRCDQAGVNRKPVDGITPRQLLAEAIEPFELFEERLANAQHWLGDREQNGVVRNEFQCPGLEPSPGYDTDPQAENL
jgi:hypothetical protein